MSFRIPPAPRCASPFLSVFGDTSLVTTVIPPSSKYYSSGKEALLTLLRQIKERRKKRFIAVQAYTCPDIATAAVEAGFKLALIDINHSTLRSRPETITVSPDDTAAIVLSNLYGMPDELTDWAEFASAGTILIDDGCQSALSTENGVAVGQRTGWGVYSFGRGKAISGVGGGTAHSPEDLGKQMSSGTAAASSIQELKALLYWIGFRTFSNPLLYGIAESLPFLNLGATEFESSVAVRPITWVERAAACAKLQELGDEKEAMIRNSRTLAQTLKNPGVLHPFKDRISADNNVVLTRYPILLESAEKRERILHQLNSSKLSCTGSYPKTLADYPELNGVVEHGGLEGSRQTAATIITLPTHRMVTTEMIQSLRLD